MDSRSSLAIERLYTFDVVISIHKEAEIPSAEENRKALHNFIDRKESNPTLQC